MDQKIELKNWVIKNIAPKLKFLKIKNILAGGFAKKQAPAGQYFFANGELPDCLRYSFAILNKNNLIIIKYLIIISWK